jgi:hypothetical protein
MRTIVLAACAVLALAAGCSGSSDPSSEAASAGTSAATGTCPVTLGNGSIPADANDWAGNDPENSHGNGKLWTLFWPYNVVIATPDFVQQDGAVRMKWPWWRGVRGELQIEGRRLDADAAPLRAEINPYYGLSGFQPSAIFFPTEGCWEVTGKVGDATLTFVTLVLKASRYSP